ncbi:MAG: hypothetical protein IT437_13505 [Phycisphaerales bacterium]|nr:hypothetical protein [Phycisphaerales bacterium]
MSGNIDKSGGTSVRLWCVAASDAPIVAVIARLYGEKRWTCLLRWNWKESLVEEGAWTSMDIAAHRCCLSSDGEFFFYHATGGSDGPFPGFYGGAFAVSRLPWLSALTDTTTFGPAGGWKSRDALPDSEQQHLWSLFEDWPAFVRDEHWPRQLGRIWRAATTDDMTLAGAQLERSHLVAAADLPDSGLRVYAVVRSHTDKWGGHHWSIWHKDLTYFIRPTIGIDNPLQELSGVRWACPTGGGRLLLATSDAKLRVLRFKYKTGADATFSVEQEHDLASLTPRPEPAPSSAKAGLA